MVKFPMKTVSEAMEYIRQLENENAELVDLLIKIHSDIVNEEYFEAACKIVSHLEEIDIDAVRRIEE